MTDYDNTDRGSCPWCDWLYIALLCFMVLFGGLVYEVSKAVGSEPETDASRAALALAKAKREREAKAAVGKACLTDLATANEECAKTGKPVVVWVGIKCADYPDLYKALDRAVHVCVREFARSSEPCVIIQGGDGNNYFVRPEKINSGTADKFKKAWAMPYVPPVRGGVGIAEEISWRRPPVVIPQVAYMPQPSRGPLFSAGFGIRGPFGGGIGAGVCVGGG